ncbi:MAG TPA: alpha-amylase family glycosyl hydrolase [Phycisphaerae bacterium]|nr:alpha-amylase family glycosyl hydrolase [Phycisphaerae bacterium]
MPIQHLEIPALPQRPRVKHISGQIRRSYPVGRQNFFRACQGEVLTLTLATERPVPGHLQVNLVTTLSSVGCRILSKIPFERADERTLVCRITPQCPGLHSFRAEYSADKGATWLRDDVPDAWVLIDPPQLDGLRVYNLIPTVSGTLADWKADLKRIADMGFNAVHLLPITALDKSESPYAAGDLFDIDQSYLIPGSKKDSLSQLEDFIAEAKRLNIRLIFDLVLNHIGVNSAMVQRAPDWIVPDQNQPDGLQRARYWANDGWHTWDDLVLIDYEHPSEEIRSEIWEYMTDYALFWANYANDTGGFVRFDNLHSSDTDFVRALTTTLHAKYPEVGILAEYFTDEHTLLKTGAEWGLNLVLATPWNYKFVPQLRDYLNYIHRISGQVRYFMPITSHDSGSPEQEFATSDATVPRYVAAALLGNGATGMPQGVEFGEKERINFIGRQPKKRYPAEAKFAPFISRVNAILAEHRAFQCGENYQFVDNGHPAVIAVFRHGQVAQEFGFLVVCNFDIKDPQSIAIDLESILGTNGPFPCSELLTGQMQSFDHPRVELELPPCTAQVLRFTKNS